MPGPNPKRLGFFISAKNLLLNSAPSIPDRPSNPFQQHRKRRVVIVLAPDQMQFALHPFAQVDIAKHHVLEHHACGAARHQGQSHSSVDQGQNGQG